MKINSLVKVGLGAITATMLLSGCVASKPLPISNLKQSSKKIEISKYSLPYKEQGGIMFNDELITDRLGNIYPFGTVGNELYYGIIDLKADKILFKNSKGQVIKEFPYLGTKLVRHSITITQNNNKELYIYEMYGDIYKSILKYDGKKFTTVMKNKDIYLDEYKIGKFMFSVPTNSLGPKKTYYQNIEVDKTKDMTKKLKRVDRDYDMVIFPVTVAGDNIIYTCDDSIFALNTITNKITTLANKDSMIQFLKNGYNYYLRVLDNPKDVYIYSDKNEFDKKAKVIDLSTLNYVDATPATLNKMKIVRIIRKGKTMLMFETGQLEKYFRNETYNRVGFL